MRKITRSGTCRNTGSEFYRNTGSESSRNTGSETQILQFYLILYESNIIKLSMIDPEVKEEKIRSS